MKFDVLVTDSEYKHSLAAVRCLGKHDLKIITCSSKFSPTAFSKYSSKSFKYKENKFMEKLLEEIKKNKVEVVLPIGYYSNILCSKHKKKIEKFSKVPVADYRKVMIAIDKVKTF